MRRRITNRRNLWILFAALSAGGCGAPDETSSMRVEAEASGYEPVVRYYDEVPPGFVPAPLPAADREPAKPAGKYVGSQWERDKKEFEF